MYYRTYAEISLGAIKQNANTLRQRIDKDVKIMAVVKADAYGHGASEVAPLLEEKVDYFGVAALEEAVALRQNGIKKPILVLSYSSPQQYDELLKYDISQTIYDLDNAKLLSVAAQKAGKTATVHIKIDTGMSRIGFADKEENFDVIKAVCSLKGIYVEGLFTHYAKADEGNSSFSKQQLERFKRFNSLLESKGVKIPVKHACNSAGTLTIAEKFNMVRIGILLYGLYPDERLKSFGLGLTPAMKIISHVVNVREVEKGDGISYGHAFTAKQKMKIATVCIGYADGYLRALSDKGRVIINGEYANVTGKVCMDLMMVDVTHIPDVKIGDRVIVMGKESSCEVTAEEMAEKSDTINYEIICAFKNRVKRIYKK
ncbi:MAG: Alanine racemase [Firmicutes bacterium ADurb.Bin300]|nr:MAG: Alanine racemase [Firmicutes bacterium ADurb.Bin300]